MSVRVKQERMKRSLFFQLAVATTLAAGTVQAQSPTAPALGFNVFVQNGARLVNNETEGPVAMGGDLTVDGGYQVSINNPGSFYVSGVRVTLVVGGKVNYNSGALTVNQNGYVKIGNASGSTAWYTDNNGAYAPMRITPGSDYNGSPRINLQVSSNTLGVSAAVNPVFQSGVIDFAAAFATLKNNSTCMATLADNAVITTPGGSIIPHISLPSQIRINLNTGINVLNVAGSDLNNVTDWIYNTSPDANHVLVVNVTTPAAFSWSVANSGGIGFSQCPYILYNFPSCTSLTIAGYGAIEGTVFAPFADITKTANTSNIEGQVIAQSYYHNGGENHYACFAPTVGGGCGIGSTPNTAAFAINTVTQCLSGNSFVFTNGSTGTAPFTYSWAFGDGTTSTAANPVKVYTATGTYTVKLKTTGTGGADSITHTVTVGATPAYGFAIDSASQPLAGNSFTFTSTTPTTVNTYAWTFGDGATATAINPVHSYTATGYYLVGQTVTAPGGCSMYYSHYVTVTSGGVGSGSGGGLESVSLGDLVSRREYNKIKNSVNAKLDYSKCAVFQPPAPYAAAKGTSGASILQRLVPASLNTGTTAVVTSPEDLKTIAGAADVFSVDYEANNTAKAVVLAVTTLGKSYSHTKSICDRFRGATLLSTQPIQIQGFNFIQFMLRQQSGDLEYCVAFAAGKSAGSAQFDLQSKWLISQYAGDDSVFNFQVWSNAPDNTVKLANDILTNLAGMLPLHQIDQDFVMPPAYIAYGKRNLGNLDISITSDRTSTNAKIVFIEKINELANYDSLIIPVNLVAGQANNFSLPIKDGYEYEGHLFLDDTLTDDVYMADGNWSLDYDKTYTNITNYKPNNNFNRVYVDGEYPLYRSVQVNAGTSDYISVYKFIASGEDKTDLTAYHSFKFFAKGSGTVEIRLIKDSVVNWSDQYMTTATLDPNGKSYQISFDDFTSARIRAPFNPNDIKAVVYTFIMNGTATDFSFFADEQSFSPEQVVSIKALSSKAVNVFPNPSNGTFEVKFTSEAVRDMDLVLTDIAGNEIYRQPVHAIVGSNDVKVSVPMVLPHAILLMRLGNKDVTYATTKINIAH